MTVSPAAGQPVDGDEHVLVQAADDGDGHGTSGVQGRTDTSDHGAVTRPAPRTVVQAP